MAKVLSPALAAQNVSVSASQLAQQENNANIDVQITHLLQSEPTSFVVMTVTYRKTGELCQMKADTMASTSNSALDRMMAFELKKVSVRDSKCVPAPR